MEHQSLPLPLACLDLASSSASVQLLREMFGASDCPLPSSTVHSEGPSTALALPGSVDLFAGKNLGEVRVQLGLVEIGLEERLGLGLDHKIARTFAEVEERVNRRMARLKVELQRREMELQRARRDKERLRSEKQEVEEKAAYLSRQVGFKQCFKHDFEVAVYSLSYFCIPAGLSCHGDDGEIKERSYREREGAQQTTTVSIWKFCGVFRIYFPSFYGTNKKKFLD